MAEAETEKPIPERAAAVTDCSSISYEIAQDETLCTVAVGMLDSAKGEVFEAPIDIQSTVKETVVQFVKIVREELESEEYLVSNGNNIEAKDDRVIADNKEGARDISDENVTAIDEGRTADESTSQSTKADAQVILSEAQTKESEHELQDKTDIESLEHVDEAKHIKRDDEGGIFNVESDNDIDRVPDAEPSEKENMKESLEIISKQDSEPAEGDELDSSPGAVTEGTEELKLERGEVMQDEIAEMGKYNDEQTNTIDSVSEAEYTEKGSTQEPLKASDKEDIEPAKDEPEKGKPESSLDAVPVENKGKNLERVYEEQHVQDEDKHVEIDERTNDIYLPPAKLSEKENTQETLENIAKEDIEPAKEPECGNLQSSLDVNKNEPTKDEPDPEKSKDDKLERVNYDKKVKIETKTRNSDDERSQYSDSISDAGPSDKENRQVIPALTGKEHVEDVESSLVAVPEEPKASMMPHNGPESCRLKEEHEKVTTTKKELVVNVEGISTEDEKKYEPAKKAEFDLLPECQDKMTESTETMTQDETVTANETNEKKADEEIGGSPLEQRGILETTRGEMHETTTRDKIIHGPENYIEQIAHEIEPENLGVVLGGKW